MSIRPRPIHLALAAFLAAGGALSTTFASADEVTAHACLEAGNVWVHIEYTETQYEGGCATDFATGRDALISAGFTPAEDVFPGMVSSINGYPEEPGQEDWWSSWYTLPVDGDLGQWSFHQVGYTQSEPEAGSIEAWKLQTSWSDTVVPQVDPLELPEAPVEPYFIADPSNFIVGEPVTITAGAFAPGADVQLEVTNSAGEVAFTTAFGTADDQGEVVGTVTFPADLPAGQYVITLSDGQTTVQAPMAIDEDLVDDEDDATDDDDEDEQDDLDGAAPVAPVRPGLPSTGV